MSGHSKWSQIKRQKGAADVKRGNQFTKMAREIMVAAREGGPSPEANFRLRLAIDRARGVNMPKDSIQRAIERATGGGEGTQLESVVYELNREGASIAREAGCFVGDHTGAGFRYNLARPSQASLICATPALARPAA